MFILNVCVLFYMIFSKKNLHALVFCQGFMFPGTGVTNSCELSCGCWELNLGPLEEQSVLLTAESSLQLLLCHFSFYFFSFCYLFCPSVVRSCCGTLTGMELSECVGWP